MRLPLIVDPRALNEALNDPHVIIVDVRTADGYEQAHLPGARHLDPALLNRSEPPVNGLLPDERTVQQWITDLGLNPGDHVVACDQGGETAAARLLWVLHSYGFSDCSWLNAGFQGWLAESFDSTSKVPAVAAGSLKLTPGRMHRIAVDELMTELDDPQLSILDVRSRAEYDGRDVRSAMGGHVPGAIHQEWTTLLTGDGRLKDGAALKSELESLGVTAERKVVVYCQSHQRSALTWLALKSLGYESVRAIDGAWSAWGNRPDTPKQQADRP